MDALIDDIYITYLSCNKAKKELMKFTNKSAATVNKYIFIKEHLDDELFRLLGTKQITIDIAHYLSKWVLNQSAQVALFPKLKGLKTPDKKLLILNETSCMICGTDSGCLIKEYSPCCNNSLCFDCMKSIITTSLTEPCLQLIKCPFCREILPESFLQPIFDMEEWRSQSRCFGGGKNHFKNLQKMYVNSLRKISNKGEHLTNETLLDVDEKMKTSHFGNCLQCINRVYVNLENFRYYSKYKKLYLKNINIGEVQKECVNVDAVIKPDMFTCVVCKDRQENPVIKKCPHCGIRTLQPDGCNHVRCECGHKWCFVCNMRVEDNWNGHNAHYYIGQGSSAYDYACRISTKYKGEAFVIYNCSCDMCSARQGRALCATLDCDNTVMNYTGCAERHNLANHIHCKKCRKNNNNQ